MNRAERRARTERVVKRRWREWELLVLKPRQARSPLLETGDGSRMHPAPGVGKKRSLFDCGQSQCAVCANETRRPAERREVPEF